jgi:hypothetical protein
MTTFKTVVTADRIDQGDIFKDIHFPALDTSVNAVVITPTCDLEHGKAHFVKFVASVPLDFVIRIIADSLNIALSLFKSDTELTKSQCNNLVRAVKRNTNGDYLPRFYLVTAYSNILPACYLDFQRVFVVPFLQVQEDYLENRVAKLDSPWREQILAQYSGYSMRVGTPDYLDDELRNLINLAGLNLPTQDT